MNNRLEKLFLEGLTLHKEQIFRICSVYSSTNEDATDIFQEVLIQIWKALPNFGQKASIGTWMYRITLNCCLRVKSNASKRQKLLVNFDQPNLENIEAPTQATEDDKLHKLKECIKQLKEGDKAIITLYLENLPYKEISEITGLLENTIAVKVRRIKNKLFNCINSML